MKFEITFDNQPFLDARGKIILNACPGSGKTSCVAYKLGALTTECEAKYGSYAGIACLSFTNVAKDEIGSKFYAINERYLTYPNLIATIDHFINNYITLPFYYLLGYKTNRPIILNVVSFLDEVNVGYFVKKGTKTPLKYSYKPSNLNIEMDGSFSNGGKKPNPDIVDLAIFNDYASKFKKWQFDNGYINNDDSSYLAYVLLKTYPDIAKNLVKRFPFIIIDEAQDTSEIQYAIFDLLTAAGLENIELIGDPYQSLYEFREARPDLFLTKFADTTNWLPLRLKDCRRSSQKIVNAYSIFRGKDEAIASVSKHTTDHTLNVIRFDETNYTELIEKFEQLVNPSDKNYVLVRGTTHLQKLGAKPFDESPWKNDLAMSLIHADKLFQNGNTKACIDAIRTFLIEISLPAADRRDKRHEIEKIRGDIDINIQLFDFLRDMPSIDDTLQSWTNNITQYIKAKLNIEIDLQLKQKGKAFYDLNIKTLLYPPMTFSLPVSTIHKVKGMTFDSVLLVLSEKSSGQSISLSDFKAPDTLPNERQRMIYVALSRPETLACIAIPNSISEKEIESILGSDLNFI